MKNKIKIYDAEVDITSFVKDKEEELLRYIDDFEGCLTDAFETLLIKHQEFIKDFGLRINIPDTPKGEKEYTKMSELEDNFLNQAKKELVKAFVKDLFFDQEE